MTERVEQRESASAMAALGGAVIGLKKGLAKLLEWAVIVLMAVLVFDVLWGVFSRYVLGAQSRWTEELATMLLVWVALLGGSVAFGVRGHLGVDYFVGKLEPGARFLIDVVVDVLVGIFATAVMIVGGYILVERTLAAGQVTPAMGIKVGYFYLAVPISGVFILLFCIDGIYETLSGRAGPSANSSEQVG